MIASTGLGDTQKSKSKIQDMLISKEEMKALLDDAKQKEAELE